MKNDRENKKDNRKDKDKKPEAVVSNFYESYRRMPTYSEMMKLFGYRSKNSVSKLVARMEGEGIISKDSSGRLIPNMLFGEVKLLGVVEAGFPTPAEESLLDSVSLDTYLIDNREATFMLKVKGDSMYDAGIREGDMVLVERTTHAKIGAIVIAEIDGAWTMKYLRKQGSYYYLDPANKKFKPIFPKEDLKIAAVVKAVIRKY